MVEKSDHLYFGVMSHEDGMNNAEETNEESRQADLLRRIEETEGPVDLTRQIFVLASSKEEAEARVKEHFGYTTLMHLAPAGMAWVNTRDETFHAMGVRAEVDWRELEKCPECDSTELRHDATCGETDCVSCGWSMEWAR